ncbi:hypothetical protein TIFTF001_004429 [Ficus carica]|uniref:Cyanobacterial aminoacyl-tRNA synthetase CAAD domain-containing protein n=1 Tax=Ficus carica TaxID=3494 RepID=A0AA87ZJ80_FICCA|nr:hypothetical protein TIFTF001_004429 [Ficus carica]
MELCLSRAMSKLPNHNNRLLLNSNPSHLHCKSSSLIPLRRTSLLSPAARGLRYRLVYYPKCLPRSTTSEETSSGASQYTKEVTPEETSSGANQYTNEATSEETSIGTNQYTGEKLDSMITFEDVSPVEKKSDNDVLMTGVTEEGPPVDEENSLISELLDKLNIDSEDTYLYLLYGGGASIALWLASAVVGAVDSIPLFPKLLEIVGLGYTAWFTYRYLLFKKNREELFARFEELKEEIIGSDED